VVEWIDLGVPEARQVRREVLVGQPVGYDTADGSDDRPPVESHVHGPSQLRIVAKQRLRRIEDEHPQRVARFDEELRFVNAVLPDEPAARLQGNRPQGVAPVGVATLDSVEHLLFGGCRQIDVEPVHVVRSLAGVVRVAPDRDPLAGSVVGHVVRAGRREGAHAFGVGGERRQARRRRTAWRSAPRSRARIA
jgi:hypothetical protein